MTVDEALYNIRLAEYKKRFPSFNYFEQSRITRTSELAKEITVKGQVSSMTFQINYRRVLLYLLLAAIVLLWLYQQSVTDWGAEFYLGSAITLIAVVSLVISSRRGNSNDLSKQFVVSVHGMEINDTLYRWNEIQETAIMVMPGEDYPNEQLVILFMDDTYEVWEKSEIEGFVGSTTRLASFIEHYKK